MINKLESRNILNNIMNSIPSHWSRLEALNIISTLLFIKEKKPEVFIKLSNTGKNTLLTEYESELKSLSESHTLDLSGISLANVRAFDIQTIIDAIPKNISIEEFIDECIQLLSNSHENSQAIANDTEVKLILNLIGNTEDKTVFDANAGFAAIGAKIKAKQLLLQYMNPSVGLLATIFLTLLDKNFKYSIKDSLLDSNAEKGFSDITIIRPPLGLRLTSTQNLEHQPYLIPALNLNIPTSATESLWLQLALYSLNKSGQAFVSVSPGWLFRSGYDAKVRELLIENELIDSVIMLPSGYLNTTNIQVALIVINKEKKKAQPIRMIDARDLGNRKRRTVEFYDSEIALISSLISDKEQKHEICKDLYLSEIRNNDYALDFNRYFIKHLEFHSPDINLELKNLDDAIEKHSKAQKRLVDLLQAYK